MKIFVWIIATITTIIIFAIVAVPLLIVKV